MARIGRDDGHQDLRGGAEQWDLGEGRGLERSFRVGLGLGRRWQPRSRPLGFRGGPCLHGGVEGFSPVCGVVWVTNTPTLQEDAGGGGC